MSNGPSDPLTRHPERLRIVATRAALPGGDALSAARMQDMLRLPDGRLVTGLRELGHAGYVRTGRPAPGHRAPAALTRGGRAALDRVTAVLWRLTRVASQDYQPPAPGLCAGDADRDAATAALGQHFAHGRLTTGELNARLEATLTATTQGDLSQAALDLPVTSARVSLPREKRARPGHKPGSVPGQDAWLHRRSRTRGRSS
jgi:Domain of unknown function (DUF1707)